MIQQLALPGMWSWSSWQADRQLSFTSYLFVSKAGNVAFDPLAVDDAEAAAIDGLGGVSSILLTNRDHERAAAAMRARFGARVKASRSEAPLFAETVDDVFDAPGEISPGIRSIALEGAKTPGEVAFVIDDLRAAVVGDALIGAPAGSLDILPEAKLLDPAALLRSLRQLWGLQLDALLLGDGFPVLAGADEVLGAFLEARGGPDVNRINLGELAWRQRRNHGKYGADVAEVGLLIGARRLGYWVVRVQPGRRFCPLHTHDREEELFYVLEGRPTVRTSRGNVQLRPGDFIAFPVGERGAHQLLNETDGECALIMLGGNDDDEVCYYPDSQKFAIGRHKRIVRGAPVDYFEGE
jgi:uncharacterized cupin superfamily protein/glyoxylase-like metal-dependent hydrolase (beta-lactamase superfamily II)